MNLAAMLARVEHVPGLPNGPWALLDGVLDAYCEKLQLTPTMYGAAEQHYQAVGQWLSQDAVMSAFKPTVYPQGSVAIKTTTRPHGRQEYDVDLVMELTSPWRPMDPLNLLALVEARFKAHSVYAPMVERKKRCVCLNYAGDFHLDVLPAIPDGSGTTKVLVPDRRLEEWVPSNPKGFVAWFEKRNLVLLKDAIHPLPPYEPAESKSTLRRVVQLLKRARDVYFERKTHLQPPSIVLTTLAALQYRGEESVCRAFGALLQRIRTLASAGTPIVVKNPTNEDECLSELWDKRADAYSEFLAWLDWLDWKWSSITANNALSDLPERAGAIFGERNVLVGALTAEVEKAGRVRHSGNMFVGRTGLISVGGGVSPVMRNTFHGG